MSDPTSLKQQNSKLQWEVAPVHTCRTNSWTQAGGNKNQQKPKKVVTRERNDGENPVNTTVTSLYISLTLLFSGAQLASASCSVISKNAPSSPFFCWCHYYPAVSRFHQTSSLVSAGGSTFSRDALLPKLRCSFLFTEQKVTQKGEHRRTKGINSQHFPRQQHAGGHHRRQVLMEPTNDCYSPNVFIWLSSPKATSLKMPQKIRFTQNFQTQTTWCWS